MWQLPCISHFADIRPDGHLLWLIGSITNTASSYAAVDHLNCLSRCTWESRRRWFEAAEEAARGQGGYLLSKQACALTADVQSAFCARTWAAVLILSVAVVDAALRETEAVGFRGGTKALIDTAVANPTLHEIRDRRNRLVHVDLDRPALTVDQQWEDRDALEQEARRAVELMFEAFYISPCK